MYRLILLAVLGMLFLSETARAQTWRETYQKAQQAYESGQMEDATKVGEQCLTEYLAQSGETNDNYAAILRLLSNVSYSIGNFAGGLDYVTRELQIRSNRKDTTYAIALTNQALFLQELELYEKAIASLTEAKTLMRQVYPEEDLRVIECTIQIGVNEYLRGHLLEASAHLTPALAEVEKQSSITETTLIGFYYDGLVQNALGLSDQAIRLLLLAKKGYETTQLTSDPNYPLVILELARAFAGAKKLEEADGSFESAQKSYEAALGKTGELYFDIVASRGINMLQMGKLEEAMALVSPLKGMQGADLAYGRFLNRLAAFQAEKGRYKEAEAVYHEALTHYQADDADARKGLAETHQNMSILYAEQGVFPSALTELDAARQIMHSIYGPTHIRYVVNLGMTGGVQTRAGKLEDAEKTFKEAMTTLASMPSPPRKEWVEVVTGAASLEMTRGNFKRADSLLTALLQPYDQSGQKDLSYATILNNLAASKQAQGQWGEAHRLIKTAAHATGALAGKGSVRYGLALQNLAGMNLRMGDLSQVLPELDSVQQILATVEGKETLSFANLQMDLGRYYQVTGDYTRAEPYLKSAREIIAARLGEDNKTYALSLNALALLYQTLGNYRDAEPLLKQALTILEKSPGKMSTDYSTGLQNLATLYQLEGRLQEAEPLLKESLATDRQLSGEDNPQYTIALQNLATLHQKLGHRDEARTMLEQVLASTERQLGKRHPSYATTLSNLAALYQDTGDYARAEELWKNSVNLRRELLGEEHPDYARSLYGLAGVYHGTGKLEEARKYYEPVVAQYQKQVVEFFPSLSEKEKGAFYAKIKPVFDSYQDFCVQYIRTHPAEEQAMVQQLFNLQLSTKAILLNATNKVRARIQASGDAELQRTFREWLTLKETIVRNYNLTSAEREKYHVNLADMEAQANDLEKQLSEKSDAFRSQFEKEAITWQAVRSALGEREAAVEILRVKKKYVKDSVYYLALILKKEDAVPAMVIWPQGTQLETRRFRYHRNTIKFHFKDTLSYQYYWQPMAKSLEGVSTLFMSCDGVFNKVNFNSIYNPAHKKYIIEDYTLHLLSNTRELAERTAFTPAKNDAVLLGFADFNLAAANTVGLTAKRSAGRTFAFDGEDIPVLPATEKEVDQVAQLLRSGNWTVDNFKRQDATEEVIKKSSSPRLIHIATHGFFLSDVDVAEDERSELITNPLFRSGVLLAGAGVERSAMEAEDGVLTAYEAMNLNLDKTEMVVLSACETGLGEVRNGEGVYGLQRSFLVAGANAVLMSLWQVDDVATQELMDTYYAYWMNGTEKHAAFRKAQLDMKDKFKEPYFWGAFVLIGY